MNLLRLLFILLGTLSLGIGILGIFIPVLPTTPFILLTAGLYMRSSDRLYQKIIKHPHIGKYIHDFHSNKGMTLRIKVISISMMWIMICCSCLFFVQNNWMIIGLVSLGVTGTLVMGFIVNTVEHSKNKSTGGNVQM